MRSRKMIMKKFLKIFLIGQVMTKPPLWDYRLPLKDRNRTIRENRWLEIYEAFRGQEKDELYDALLNVNDGDITVKHKFGPRDKHCNHWIIEVIPEIRNKLLEKDRVYLGWSSCIVRDHIRILRCYKSQKFGHHSLWPLRRSP
ncbi:unnamed protein product [Psylliodes chrysocephalus]|uniref:Uncharacterized protein n=1 Tax=Psylliodes chrysocephalus TaxID=3402493 RepID=A0A9P0DDK1_9CUCU|nr:unnamed protein product [Psylliodes chrysocephala]